MGSTLGAELGGSVALSMECHWCINESKLLAVSVCHTPHNEIDDALLMGPTNNDASSASLQLLT